MVVSILIVISLIFAPRKVEEPIKEKTTPQPLPLNQLVREFLISKESPLAPDTDFLLQQKHWKLLIAISAIESQFCKRKISFNCWGIGGDSAYRHYSSYTEAIKDANDLIERWQLRGRWLTIDDMNCHYVVPCNPNWVRVVNYTLKEIDDFITSSNRETASDDKRQGSQLAD